MGALRIHSLSVGLLGLLLALGTYADEKDDETLRCISMGSVRATAIVDDTSILFFQRRGTIYLNTLDRRCVGLRRNGKFTYQVASGARHVRVCNTDSITVLENTGRGFNCGLGDFVPVDETVAQQLLDPSAAAPPGTIVAEPVEPPSEPEGEPTPDQAQ